MTIDSISSIERQQQILKFLNREHRISVGDICSMLSISEATARRDLKVLSDHNHLQRVHGGAIALNTSLPERPIIQREKIQTEEKRMIAQAVAGLINDGETIFLGSGSTVLEVAKALRDRKALKIVTNSLPVLNTMTEIKDLEVIALGGVLRESELSFIGHITEQALSEIRVSKVILGVHAIDVSQGLTSDFLPETMTDRAIIKAGKEVIVVADHTKINMVSAAYLAPMQSIQKLVTDAGAPDDFINALREMGIDVVIA